VGAFTLAAAAVTLLLSPVLWREPLGTLSEMWRARKDLVAAQVTTTREVMPWAVLDSPGERSATLLVHLYFSPLQFAEAANYLRETAGSEANYLANPFHSLFRGLAGGALLLVLTLVGIHAGPAPRPPGSKPAHSRTMPAGGGGVRQPPGPAVRRVSTLRHPAALVCLWSGYALSGIIEAATRNRRPIHGTAVGSGG
jgi:hypothetical protein